MILNILRKSIVKKCKTILTFWKTFIIIWYKKISEADGGVSLSYIDGRWCVYVIRASIFVFYIHIDFWTCHSNCCRSCLICSIGCYNKKNRQTKKYISAWPLEMYFYISFRHATFCGRLSSKIIIVFFLPFVKCFYKNLTYFFAL